MSVETAHVLRVDASARTDGSVTRALADRLVETMKAGTITRRDLAAEPIPQLTEDWVAANFTEPGDRTAEQNARLAQSDALVAELQTADTLVIATPIYNFGVPAALKAWIDMVARAGVTFRYTADGPVGLLAGKKAYIVLASGGTGRRYADRFRHAVSEARARLHRHQGRDRCRRRRPRPQRREPGRGRSGDYAPWPREARTAKAPRHPCRGRRISPILKSLGMGDN